MPADTPPDPAALLAQLREARAALTRLDAARREPIAIIGMGCRFPGGAEDPQAFLRALLEGRDAITEVPPDRWDIDAWYDPDPAAPGRMASRWGGFLPDIAGFDAGFFGISPREAARLDPQHRLFLECAVEAIEDAGLPMEALRRVETGVFAALYNNDYQMLQDPLAADAQAGTGTSPSMAAGRLAFLLDLGGPAMVVDTVCSSALVALHLACTALRQRECDIAIVGAANVICAPENMVVVSKLLALSPDGRCRAFDSGANGYVRAEGAGVVVLKRAADAEAARDRVHARVLGSAVAHDGRAAGLTAPNPVAQARAITTALKRARVTPEEIGFVETHGTGTPLGDPIEAAGLATALGTTGPECLLGAVKTNLGHTEAAAGMAGLIKTALVLREGVVPGNLHLRRPNPRAGLEGTRFRLPTAPTPWQGAARRAGVSAFGVSGTNAHAVLAPAAEPPAPAPAPRGAQLLAVSGRGRAAAAANARAMAAFLRGVEAPPLGDVLHTALARRTHHADRIAVVAEDAAGLADALDAAAAAPAPAPGGRLVLLFGGQGAQWAGMERALAELPGGAVAMAEVMAALAEAGAPDMAAFLAAGADDPLRARVDLVQPAIFAVQAASFLALSRLGLRPDAVVGHSLGEVAAAFAAGALPLADAARLAVARSAALARIAGQGAMALLDLPETEAEALRAELGLEGLSVAAVNGPRSTVLSGEAEQVARLVAAAAARNRFARRLQVEAAAHSPQVEALLPRFLAELGELPGATMPALPLVSTVTGAALAEAPGPAYWAANLRRPVRFWPVLEALLAQGPATLLELGPHPVLLPGLERAGAEAAMLPLWTREAPRASALTALARLHAQGRALDLAPLAPAGRVVGLPLYRWQRRRHWHADRQRGPGTGAATESPAAFYDWLAQVHDVEREEVYLTYGIMAAPFPDFSLARAFAWPRRHAALAEAARESQRELRRLLFRHADFGRIRRVLDFGCGYASDLARLAGEQPHITALGQTISPGQAETGRRKLAALGLADRVAVEVRDSAHDPAPGPFDLAFGFEVVSHIRDKRGLFRALAAQVAEGGLLLVADFWATGLTAIEHAESSSFIIPRAEWVERLSEAGFAAEAVVDVTPEVLGVFTDPDQEGALAEVQAAFGAAVAESLRAYVSLGALLGRGLARYVLVTARRVPVAPELAGRNAAAFAAPLDYATATAEVAEPVSPPALPPSWTAHEVGGRALLSAAAMLRLMAGEAPGGALSDIGFEAPLPVAGEAPPALLRRALGPVVRLEGPEGLLARASRAEAGALAPLPPVAGLQPIASGAFYARLALRGTRYAAPLRVLSDLMVGEGVAEAAVRAEGEEAAWEALFQAVAAAVPGHLVAPGMLALPVGLARCDWAPGPDPVRVAARLAAQPDGTLLAEAVLSAADGTPRARLAGLRLKQVPRAALAGPAPARLALEWVPVAIPPPAGATWTVLAEDAAAAAPVAAALGAPCLPAEAAPGEGHVLYVAAPGGDAAARLARLGVLLRAPARLFVLAERAHPEGAALWGFAAVAALEAPQAWGAVLDPGGAPSAAIAAALAGWREGGEDRLCLGPDGAPLAQRLVRAQEPPAQPFAADPDGAWLVTGATGALGRRVIPWLAGQGARRFVLLSRRRDPELEAELSAAGLEVTGLAGEAAQVARLLPPGLRLAGAFHLAASMAPGAPLATRDAADYGAALGPKLGGAHALAEVLPAGAPLVLFGSVAALWGFAGMAPYAAANAALEALATARPNTLLVHWGIWQGSAGDAEGARAIGLRPLAPGAALEALGRSLAAGHSGTTILCDADWRGLHGALSARRPCHVLAGLAAEGDAALSTTAALDRAAVIARIRALVAELLGFAPEEVAEDAGFFALGMDSIVSVELRNRVEAAFGRPLTAATLFNHPTAAELAEVILGAPATEPPPTEEVAETPELAELLRRMEAL
ncbi:MAG TPA: beta-ketoacyl synthase N-terminal-like domain-containing protein [Roseococcus sp.]|jgi:acyl transferase domain-containing protein/acyl carrier protein|nr:beta-ketoacyl synthase N-terminal-like domain-containing protein [Roseococcus sp.]